MKKVERFLAIFLAFVMVLAIVPVSTANAVSMYTIAFGVPEADLTMAKGNNCITVGETRIEFVDHSDASVVFGDGSISVAADGKAATVTIPSGTTVEFRIYGSDCTLTSGSQTISPGFTTDTDMSVNVNAPADDQDEGDDANGYNISFSATEGHEIAMDSGVLVIDGQSVVLQNEGGQRIGDYFASDNMTSGVIEVNDGTPGTLVYNSGNAFTLFNTNGHVAYNNEQISSNTVFNVEDFAGDNPGEDSVIGFKCRFVGSNIITSINDGEDQNGEPKFKEVYGESDKFDQEEYVNEAEISAGATTDPDEINLLMFRPRFGDYPLKEVTINGVKYTEESEGCFVDGDIWYVEVPGDIHYEIDGIYNPNAKVPRTIIWANVGANENAEGYAPDMLLKHGKAKILGVYDPDGNKVSGEVDVDANGMGWAVVEPGNTVYFEFVPEYGYQLTSVSANGFPLEPQDTVNTYAYIMPDTNVHFAAEFTETADVVEANSKTIKGGSVELGSALPGGSAKVEVTDVEPSAEKQAQFATATAGYEVAGYVDISMDNVYYKGKKDAVDVWTEEVHNLDKAATMTIQLNDEYAGKDIAIAHNIDNGDKIEILELKDFDPTTKKGKFETTGFSTYAIIIKDKPVTSVTKSDAKTTTSAKTSDTFEIIPVATIMLISAIGAAYVISRQKKEEDFI